MTDPTRDVEAVRSAVAGANLSRRQVLAVGGVGLGALLFAGCSSSPASAPRTSGPAQAPKKGGIIKMAVSDGQATDSLDPGLIISQNTAIVCNALYDSLTRVDDDFVAKPALAESWESTPDALTWTFRLRPGVKWHDGSDFTSADVAATLKRWVDPKSGNEMYGGMSPYIDPSGIETPDPLTVVVKLKTPNSILPALVGSNWNAKITKAGTTSFTPRTAIGTGPFKLTSWTAGTAWAAARNDAYWGGAPYLDGIEVKITPDQGAKLQGILAGSTDVTDDLPISYWTSLKGRSDVSVQTFKNKSAWVFAFDQRHAPYDNQKVLEALKLATDRDTMLRVALQGHGVLTDDFGATPGSVFYPTGHKSEFNIEKAKSLLAEAGYPKGLDIELSTSNVTAGMLDVAQAWQQVVKPAGFNVTLKQFPLNTYWDKGWMATPAFQDYWNRFHPAQMLQLFYMSSGPWWDTRYQDPRLADMVAGIMKETDPTTQAQLIQAALVMVRETYSFVVPFYTDGGWAQSNKVNGVVWDFVNQMDFRKAWMSA
ncbi:ABC transporter substrate-binding protein [Nocardioides pocheonensis]|uniref:ABC transporter substrate-binding protein n=1 Tax=Nocardioides pocheonensis TaxID=661485 RepID=A0A3N0GJ42_9ACTN|nr:ABC transporter substrate-binding protein [Nocardioides pocheonensis]RNM12060.1 ABC transporter substrate-binding protein [Nocardioides pocheonensis]